MTATTIRTELPSSPSEFDGWLQRLNASRVASGGAAAYVAVEEKHFHVAKTPEGELVSRVQWIPDDLQPDHFRPRHNMFVVTHEQRTQAIHAWRLLNDAQYEPSRVERTLGAGRMR